MKLPRWALALLALLSPAWAARSSSPWEREIVYQIFPRSFYDSNGDRIGDFKGIAKKLGYVSDLGATAILLQPILKSRLYHNYFADDYFHTDPSLGTNKQFFDMVRAAHRRRLKVILDMELQYVASEHPWYVAAARHPGTPEGTCVDIKRGFCGYTDLPAYNGTHVRIAVANTHNSKVLETWRKVFLYWSSPPGRPQDGVDGFRLDHMMDDLDNAHWNADLYARIWVPLERAVRRLKPSVFFVAEQSDWGLGKAQFEKGSVDAVYAIPLASAFRSMDAARITKEIKANLAATPSGKTQLVFVEDHDVDRFASVVKNDPALLRLGAVMALTSKGTPSIYYGQELGMKGQQLKGKTDGNDIPDRLAMRWSKSLTAPGTPTWYGPGPWNLPKFIASDDGVSVKEQQGTGSLLEFYRRLIRLRRGDQALSVGSEKVLTGLPTNVVAFIRSAGSERVLVVLNVGTTPALIPLPKGFSKGRNLWTRTAVDGTVRIPARDFAIVRL